MSQANRRVFLMQVATAAGVVAVHRGAQAQAMASETDPVSMNFGYKEDAAKVDKAKQPKYAAGQTCANCSLFQAPATAATGPCPLFPGKQVTAKGWCNAWVKKA